MDGGEIRAVRGLSREEDPPTDRLCQRIPHCWCRTGGVVRVRTKAERIRSPPRHLRGNRGRNGIAEDRAENRQGRFDYGGIGLGLDGGPVLGGVEPDEDWPSSRSRQADPVDPFTPARCHVLDPVGGRIPEDRWKDEGAPVQHAHSQSTDGCLLDGGEGGRKGHRTRFQYAKGKGHHDAVGNKCGTCPSRRRRCRNDHGVPRDGDVRHPLRQADVESPRQQVGERTVPIRQDLVDPWKGHVIVKPPGREGRCWPRTRVRTPC